MSSISLNAELAVIRDAANLLAKRFVMMGDLLTGATATFESALQSDAQQVCSADVQEQIATLAAELSDARGLTTYVQNVQSFEASALIGRILDLSEEISSSTNSPTD